MSKCKITVLRKMFYEDLVKEYCKSPTTGPCKMFSEGQEIILDGPRKPADFCDEAWATIDRYVFAFTNGGSAIFNGNWMKDDNTLIACCSDGVRPVIFKLEKIEE